MLQSPALPMEIAFEGGVGEDLDAGGGGGQRSKTSRRGDGSRVGS